MRPGATSISGLSIALLLGSRALDEHVGEQSADEPVEDDGLRQREPEPLDARQLAAELRLARDRLDHRREDQPDAHAGADGAEADPQRERDRLPGVDAVVGL